MKKFILASIIGLGVLAFGALIITSYVASKYNNLAKGPKQIETLWANVQNQYTRRFDLIPNLVEVVKGAANFEKSTLVEISQARASVGQIKMDGVPDKAKMEQFAAAQQTLGTALSRLMVVAEKYPELRATEQFRDLTTELAGTENRIAIARRDYVMKVGEYNQYLVSFPNNIIAGIFNFKEIANFQAEKGAEKAPVVKF